VKWLSPLVTAIVLIAVCVLILICFNRMEVQHLRSQVQALQDERARLMEYARRLSANRRVAQVEVVNQRRDDAGRTITTLLWQEIGRDGTIGRPLTVDAIGELVYFDALVIKFMHRYVGEGDPGRGESLALFRRAFGDRQTPESGTALDRGAPPQTGESSSDAAAALHARLWRMFWELVDDPVMAAQYGVRIAQVEAQAIPARPGQLWEISLDAAGGLNIRRIPPRRQLGAAVSAQPPEP
jgi:hypothetical protein